MILGFLSPKSDLNGCDSLLKVGILGSLFIFIVPVILLVVVWKV